MNQLAQLNKQYIGGVWRDGKSQKVLADRNPYNGKAIADFRLANLADLDEAYRSAAAAQKLWAEVNPFEKRTILEKAITWIEKNEGDIADIIIEELGGTLLKAMIEIFLVKTFIKEASTYPLRMTGEILPSTVDGKENRLYRVPAGVVGVISPFNFPFNLSMRSVAPALGTGNGVVLKPHDDTPITGGTLVARIFEEAGIPKGLLNVIVADLGEIGDGFVDHPIPRIISFTGSEAVGRHIGGVAGRCLKKAILELGGNSAFIVLEDADLETAVNAAVFSRFAHQGQIMLAEAARRDPQVHGLILGKKSPPTSWRRTCCVICAAGLRMWDDLVCWCSNSTPCRLPSPHQTLRGPRRSPTTAHTDSPTSIWWSCRFFCTAREKPACAQTRGISASFHPRS